MSENIFFILTLFSSLISCDNSKKAVKGETNLNVDDNIILIFNPRHKSNNEIKLKGERRFVNNNPEIEYIDNYVTYPIQRNYSKIDTIKIRPNDSIVLLKCRVDAAEKFEYLVRVGDTIKFSYIDSIPAAEVINRQAMKYDFNYERYRYGISKGDKKFRAVSIYYNPYLVLDWSNLNFRQQISKIRKENYLVAKSDFSIEKSLLDSLFVHELISEGIYKYYFQKNKYSALLLDLSNDKIVFKTAENIIEKDGLDSNLIPIDFYGNFVQAVAHKFFIGPLETIRLGEGSGIIRDYRKAYDTIAQTGLFKGRYRKHILLAQLEKIAEYFTPSDLHTYVGKFQGDYMDTLTINEFKRRHFLEFDSARSLTSSTYLMDNKLEKIKLEDFIKENKGKLIYIDLWASWCGPCKREMPHSKKLRDRYKSSDIIFLYLSIDKDFDSWKKELVRQKLENYKNSYLIVNYKTDSFLKRIELGGIPRYLLFSKQGRLLFSKAPAPSSKDLVKYLDKHLMDDI